MSGHRAERISQRILEEVSLILSREIQDPQIAGVNVTRVDVSGDLRVAKIFVAAPVDAEEAEMVMEGLERASRYFRRRLAENMEMRLVPEVRFALDYSIAKGERFLQVLEQVQREEQAAAQNRKSNRKAKK
jgi:ribosome-binding factor A